MLYCVVVVDTFGSSGGSYWTIQSTSGMSSPLAATSVHSRMPESALQNWKKVVVRLVCFCLPWDDERTCLITTPGFGGEAVASERLVGFLRGWP